MVCVLCLQNNLPLVLSLTRGRPTGGVNRNDPWSHSPSPAERITSSSNGLHGNHMYTSVHSYSMEQPLALTKSNLDSSLGSTEIPGMSGPVERKQVSYCGKTKIPMILPFVFCFHSSTLNHLFICLCYRIVLQWSPVLLQAIVTATSLTATRTVVHLAHPLTRGRPTVSLALVCPSQHFWLSQSIYMLREMYLTCLPLNMYNLVGFHYSCLYWQWFD